MQGWIKIHSFDRFDQVVPYKQMLEENALSVVVVPRKDSAFQIGSVELYVHHEHVEEANFLIEHMRGNSLVNAMTRREPVERLAELLVENGITPLFKLGEEEEALYPYELYVKNEEYEKCRVILDVLPGWVKLDSFEKIDQTTLLVDLLEQAGVPTLVLRKQDSDLHLEEIKLYVEAQRLEQAQELVEKMPGWVKLREFEKFHQVELVENEFDKRGINHFLRKQAPFTSMNSTFELWVPEDEEAESLEALAQVRAWGRFEVFDFSYQAEMVSDWLEQHEIESVIVRKRDTTFMIGSVELWIESENFDRAKEALDQLEDGDEWGQEEGDEEEDE